MRAATSARRAAATAIPLTQPPTNPHGPSRADPHPPSLCAAALSYGIYKTDLPADKATNVVFLDMGASDTTVSIVSFVKGKLTVLSTACDRRLGGE